MRVKEAKEAIKRRRKVRQMGTGIKGRIMKHYGRNLFLFKSQMGIIKKANAGDLTLVRRGKSDG